jgi:radical SAM protein with 4Fe4S-binding SPASM domain
MRLGPDYIQFYPTLRCNSSCSFCFNRSIPPAQDMSLASFFSLLSVLKETTIKTVDIMGGEPTLHPDIVRFAREFVKCGFLVNVSSNGFNQRVLAELADIGGQVTIGISVNDRNSFEQILGFVRPHKTVVKSIFKSNMDYHLIQRILLLEPKKYYLIYQDAADRQDLINTVPFPVFVETVEQCFGPDLVGGVYCSGFLPDKSYPELIYSRCPAGTTKLGVMPDGSAYPCNLFFGKTDFLLGNILTDPFDRIWRHRLLAFFREYHENTCTKSSCRLHALCHGGCPAQSFLFTGDLAAPDPRCWRFIPEFILHSSSQTSSRRGPSGPSLSHHRTCRSAYGGSCKACKASMLCK